MQVETELKFLKAQFHPHFLFNALNTIYFQIDEKNETPRRTIEQLSDLLRYQLYDVNQAVTIEQEINFLLTYINLQKVRMKESLKLDVNFNPELKNQKIHSLLLFPLVENALKYVGESTG
jgi:Putative regulator of cell autolysis